MCLEDRMISIVNPIVSMGTRETFASVLGRCSVHTAIKAVLQQAETEKRLTVGLLAAINHLSRNYGEALFCLMAPSHIQDSAMHMQEVLLEAFCLENDIYVIKVDSSNKLHKIINGYSPQDCNCVLVHLTYSDPFIDQTSRSNIENLSPAEKLLVKHCVNNSDTEQTPIIKLPEE